MSSALIDSYLDLLEPPCADVTARRMFGGHGFYKDGVIFALEAYDRLFMLKVDQETRAHFEAGVLPSVHAPEQGPQGGDAPTLSRQKVPSRIRRR